MSKVKLKDIASFSKGKQINGDQLFDDGNYDYLNGGITPSGKWSSFNTCGDTITISEGGNSCGYVNYMIHEFWCGGHCYYLYDVKCLTKYLYYALKSQQDRIMKLRSGACMPNIKKKDLGDFVFEYNDNPDDQEKIVKEIDLIENIVRKQTQQIEKLDKLVKSRFVEMFGDPVLNTKKWEIQPVINECECMVPGRDKPKSFTGSIPWITIDDLIVNGITYSSKQGLGLTKEEIKQVNRKTIPVGSVIMSCVGNLGICSIAGSDMIINQQLHSFQCGNRINRIFLMYNLTYRKDYMNKWASNTTVLYMNKTICNSIPIMIPPIELQNQFADFVTKVEKQKVTVQKSIDKLETLKKSLMQEYFG